jgi:sugar/nucleoside kinase (ribokinase family)
MAKLDIVIVGEINLDLILYGLPLSMPTERELLGSGFSMTLGSSSAILAHNLSALGARVGFITKIGDDTLGKIAIERLGETNVDLSRVVRDATTGSGVTLILPHGGERHILTYPGTIFELRFEELDLDYAASARHFHLSSLFLHRGMRDKIPELFRLMKSKGLSTSLDTNDDPEDLWAGPLAETLPYVDIILPNEREARKIARQDDLETAISRLSEQVSTVVIKLGAKGATAVHGSERYTVAPVKVEVVDPVGAGDSFDAGFLFQYLRGQHLPSCLEYGNLAGAFSTTAPGGTEAFRNRRKLQEFFDQATTSKVAQ